MKALKEKRNSLRSLWRRSLVILSLFALVFAACGSSDSADPVDPNGPGGGPPPPPAARYVEAIRIINAPTAVSYVGFPANLDGIIAEVRWSDGRFEVVRDASQFMTWPYILTNNEASVTGAANLLLTPNQISVLTDYSKSDKISVFHVSNRTVEAKVDLPAVIPVNRLHLTGAATKRAYFEDEWPDYAGVTVEAEYLDFLKTPRTMSANPLDNRINSDWWIGASKKSIKITDVYVNPAFGGGWRSGPTGVYQGTYGTLGKHDGNGMDHDNLQVQLLVGGVEIAYSFDTLYFIRDIEMESIDTSAWGLYFEDDDPGDYDWAKELDTAKLTFKVFYDGTDETKVRTMDDYRRAQGIGMASPVVPPILGNADDPETVFCRIEYFRSSDLNVGNPVYDDRPGYPNQAISILVPSATFQDEIRFDRKELTANPRPLRFEGRTAATDKPLSRREFDAIRETYDLVGIYSLNGAEKLKKLDWGNLSPYRLAGDTWFDCGTGNADYDQDLLTNDETEVQDVTITLTIPADAYLTYGYNDDQTDYDEGLFTRYNELAAELEIQVLPWHTNLQ
jgi:hypothetical protein